MVAPPSSSSAANIMLAIFEKKTVTVDLYRPLRTLKQLRSDLQTLKQLRSNLERATVDYLTSCRDLLQIYYKASAPSSPGSRSPATRTTSTL
ncbi:Vacuolar-sorting protein BRO1 [Camellia lanceoleosa]|uniref:Vacuolar-sorting protein BRO1 n=1 Tax=Camellia lanceoleosa TaxID=1840588 RepID=A0ACC0HEH4_9ERIC|nr:Vacuolar-sorting protein BRO1 [Camellia lanceoleosa]